MSCEFYIFFECGVYRYHIRSISIQFSINLVVKRQMYTYLSKGAQVGRGYMYAQQKRQTKTNNKSKELLHIQIAVTDSEIKLHAFKIMLRYLYTQFKTLDLSAGDMQSALDVLYIGISNFCFNNLIEQARKKILVHCTTQIKFI